tara:strand:+ start:1541 stop:2275 length:735 start_codon:yes stop_codon:yes gene_type:complete
MKTLKKNINNFDYLILTLSIYVILEFWIWSVMGHKLSSKMLTILTIIDVSVCVVFIYDFIKRFKNAINKPKFILYNWVDIVGSIPLIYSLHTFRIFRIIRIFRAIKSVKHILTFSRKNRASMFYISLIGSFLICSITTLSIYILEKDIGTSQLNTLQECLWWTLYTFSSIGYQDIIPVTESAKIFALILAGGGIILLATTLSLFLDDTIQDEEIQSKLDEKQIQLDRLEEKIDNLIKKENTDSR